MNVVGLTRCGAFTTLGWFSGWSSGEWSSGGHTSHAQFLFFFLWRCQLNNEQYHRHTCPPLTNCGC